MSATAALSFLDDLDDELSPGNDRPWFIEPRDKSPASELYRQRTVIAMLRKLAPLVRVWSVPNAARRTRWETMRAKQEGMLTGALDLTIAWPGGVFFAEMKDGTGAPTPYQRELLNFLYDAGHHCGVYRTADTLVAHLRAAGAPIRDARL